MNDSDLMLEQIFSYLKICLNVYDLLLLHAKKVFLVYNFHFKYDMGWWSNVWSGVKAIGKGVIALTKFYNADPVEEEQLEL